MDVRSGIIFHQLLRAHRNAHMTALAQRGVGDIGSPHLLVALSHYPDDPAQAPTQKELADRLHIAPPTIAASLKALERDGYVARAADERDARRNRVSLTEKGRGAVQLCTESFRAVDERMLLGFTPEEARQLGGFLARMVKNLGGTQPPPFCPEGKEGGD